MKIKKIVFNEYKELLKLMNVSFSFKKKEEQFESILPKLYRPFNKDNIHIGVYVNNKLVASIGLYPMTFISKYSSIKVINIGGVSTHPKYRNRGYFTSLMKEAIKYAKDNKYDLIILGGNRIRYNHFDFENCAPQFVFTLSNDKFCKLKSIEYLIKPLKKDNKNDIKNCLKIYLANKQHNNRNVDNFYIHLLSWRARPYVVYASNKLIGYFAKRNDDILEIGYLKGYKDSFFKAILSLGDNLKIFASMEEYNKDTVSRCKSYFFTHGGMAYIINDKKICKYLNITSNEYKKAYKLNMKDKVKFLLGDSEAPSVKKKNLYIPYQDRC